MCWSMNLRNRRRKLDNFRKIGLVSTGLAITVCAFGVIASVLGQGDMAATMILVSLMIVILLIPVCTQQLLKNAETEERKSNEETRKLFELVSGLQTGLDTGISNSAGIQTEIRRLVKAQHDELIAVRHRLGVLEQQIGNSSSALEAFRKEIKNSLRDSERRIAKGTPKEFEVKRAHERVEAAERRILGALETHSYDQGVIQSEQKNLMSTLAETLGRFPNSTNSFPNDLTALTPNRWRGPDPHQVQAIVTKISRHVTDTVRDSTRQMEALVHLSSHFSDKKLPMPSTGGFALDPQALAHLISLVTERRPQRILELGSGTSTIWLGYLCRSLGSKLITLDHLEEYLELTRTAVDRHHLNAQVECRLAPLEELEYESTFYRWYSPKAFAGLSEIDMVVIDGPPASTGKKARYPALPYIIDILAANATVVLDDAHREDERAIIESWQEVFTEFTEIEHGTSRLGILERRISS